MENNRSNQTSLCPCGSEKEYFRCCEPYVSILRQPPEGETVLISWLDRYSIPIQKSFRIKAGSLVYRISIYTDFVFDLLYPLGFRSFPKHQELLDQAVRSIKHNIMLSLFASLSCLSQGLFLQSGTLIRNCIEDSLVLLDLFQNEKQLHRFLSGNYSASNVLKRVKEFIPEHFRRWYGHYSANFAHFGPLHTAPYMPKARFPDNYVLGSGLENLLLGIYMFHAVSERAHFPQLSEAFLWKLDESDVPKFSENNRISEYVHRIQKDIIMFFPPDERKEGYMYSDKEYKTK